ncbi:delta-60 repeat domain-containing protein, partial [Oleiphilus sp. HI0061]|uniref:delta-60 repeat domain-containing protein n=1 Tax=Oleiphilus sp. HI0061 TaxID=1822239 RepID=UPI0018D30527
MTKTAKDWCSRALLISKAYKLVVLIALSIGQAIAAPGDIDTSFGTNGWTITDINSSSLPDSGYATAIQSNGKIVQVGYANNSSNHDLALVRYESDGSLDSSFGDNGIVTTDIGGLSNVAYHVATQSDDKIIVAGTGDGDDSSTYSNFIVARYNTNGTLDTTFEGDSGSANGILSFDRNVGADHVFGLSVLSDDNILLHAYNFPTDGITLIKLNEDGSLDTDFDGDSGTGN